MRIGSSRVASSRSIALTVRLRSAGAGTSYESSPSDTRVMASATSTVSGHGTPRNSTSSPGAIRRGVRALKLPRPLALDPGDVRLREPTRLRAPAPPRHRDPSHAIGVDPQQIPPRARMPHELDLQRTTNAGQILVTAWRRREQWQLQLRRTISHGGSVADGQGGVAGSAGLKPCPTWVVNHLC